MRETSEPDAAGRTTRRFFLGALGVSAATLVGLTVGQSFAPLADLGLLAPRRYGDGPLGVPVNRTAEQAGVLDLAGDPSWALLIRTGSGESRSFSRDQLLALPQTTAVLPIACVEGWSTAAEWTGVRMGELVDPATLEGDRMLRITSLEPKGGYRVTTMGPEFARDPNTLVALRVNGSPLDLDHGYPARIIAPGRPGVLQTKWLSAIEVVSR